MLPKSERARQNMISLTQTEIMFVLAALVLVLLQQKNFENARLKDENVRLVQESGGAAIVEEAADGRAATPDPGEGEEAEPLQRIRRTLVETGNLAPGPKDSPGEDDRVVRAVERMSRNTAETRLDQPVKDILERARQENLAPGARSDSEVAAEMFRLAKAQHARERPADPGVSGASAAQHPRGNLADMVGFDPCWEKVVDNRVSYHLTYSTVYDRDTDRYRIRPAWDEAVTVVKADVDGPMSALREHPTGWVDRDTYAEFGRRIDLARRMSYGRGCRFVTKINDAGQAAIEFVNRYFYPVY